MVDVKSRKCLPERCGKQPSFRVAGARTAEYCVQHSKNGMVDLKTRSKCSTEGCGKEPSFGEAETKMAEYCAQHAKDGIVDVRNRKCKVED